MQRKLLKKYQQGQAMILTVLVLSSIVLSLSAIGGYLMLVRLRVSSDIGSTMRAIYIADAGLECETYNHYKNGDAAGYCADPSRNSFLSGAVDDVDNFYYETTSDPAFIRSVGTARTANRSFRLDF